MRKGLRTDTTKPNRITYTPLEGDRVLVAVIRRTGEPPLKTIVELVPPEDADFDANEVNLVPQTAGGL